MLYDVVPFPKELRMHRSWYRDQVMADRTGLAVFHPSNI